MDKHEYERRCFSIFEEKKGLVDDIFDGPRHRFGQSTNAARGWRGTEACEGAALGASNFRRAGSPAHGEAEKYVLPLLEAIKCFLRPYTCSTVYFRASILLHSESSLTSRSHGVSFLLPHRDASTVKICALRGLRGARERACME